MQFSCLSIIRYLEIMIGYIKINVLKVLRERERESWLVYFISYIKNIRLKLLRLPFSVLVSPINYSQVNQRSHKSRSRRLASICSLSRIFLLACAWIIPMMTREEKAPRLLSPAIIPRKWISRCGAAREIRSQFEQRKPSSQIRYVKF